MSQNNLFLIHESRIDLLRTKFDNLNDKINNDSSIDFTIVGEKFDDYVDSEGVKHKNSRYFEIELEGNIAFNNLDYLGVAYVTDEGNVVRPFGEISKDEFREISNRHGMGCACCNKERNRKELYLFRCTEDSKGFGGNDLKEGEIYTVGSSCVDDFTNVKALKVIQGLSGIVEEGSKKLKKSELAPKYLDPQRFAEYAMAVGSSRLDDAFQYYKENPSVHRMDSKKGYAAYKNSCKTYRRLKSNNTAYGVEGSITRTAKAAYFLNECGYVDMKFFGDEHKLKVFKDFMEYSGFNHILNTSEKSKETAANIAKSAEKIFENDSLSQIIQRKNAGTIMKSSRIHVDHAQMVTDACDVYYLKNHSGVMHEEPYARYEVKESWNGNEYAQGKIRYLYFGEQRTEDAIIGLKFGNHKFSNSELSKLFDGNCVTFKSKTKTGKPYTGTLRMNYDKESNRYKVGFGDYKTRNYMLLPKNERLSNIDFDIQSKSAPVSVQSKIKAAMAKGERILENQNSGIGYQLGT